MSAELHHKNKYYAVSSFSMFYSQDKYLTAALRGDMTDYFAFTDLISRASVTYSESR